MEDLYSQVSIDSFKLYHKFFIALEKEKSQHKITERGLVIFSFVEKASLLAEPVPSLVDKFNLEASSTLIRSLFETVVKLQWIFNRNEKDRIEKFLQFDSYVCKVQEEAVIDPIKEFRGEQWCPDMRSILKELRLSHLYPAYQLLSYYTHPTPESIRLSPDSQSLRYRNRRRAKIILYSTLNVTIVKEATFLCSLSNPIFIYNFEKKFHNLTNLFKKMDERE